MMVKKRELRDDQAQFVQIKKSSRSNDLDHPLVVDFSTDVGPSLHTKFDSGQARRDHLNK